MMDEYYKICLEQTSNHGTLLFWRPNGAGYTSKLEEAGLFDKKDAEHTNKNGRDIALTVEELHEVCDVFTVVDLPLHILLDKKEELKEIVSNV